MSYIEDIKLTDKATIKLFQVVDLYKSHLEQLGGGDIFPVTQLKEKLIAQMPDLEAHKSITPF